MVKRQVSKWEEPLQSVEKWEDGIQKTPTTQHHTVFFQSRTSTVDFLLGKSFGWLQLYSPKFSLQIGMDAKHVRLPKTATQEEVGYQPYSLSPAYHHPSTSDLKLWPLLVSCCPAGLAKHHVRQREPICPRSDCPAASGFCQPDWLWAHHQRRLSG